MNDVDKLIYNLKKNLSKKSNFKCNKCNSNFTQKSSLKTHLTSSKCSRNENINTIPINPTPIITSSPIETNDNQSFNYVYLIEKFDVNNKQSIFKFGKTNRESSKRLKEHGEEAKVLLILDVIDCNIIEKKILNILNNTENIKKCSFGKEYFICNDKEFLITIILKNI
jgi:hypothetical protein